MQTPREICLKLLVSTEQNSGYSNIVLDKALLKYDLLKDVDRRFITALYYGVIERRLTLDAVIAKYSNRPADKLSLAVNNILRMGIYQLLYMDSVPDSAAVNESVALTKDNKNPAISGFVNAVLRSFIRDGKAIPKTGKKIKDLSIEYSCPEWIVEMWLKDYGEDVAYDLLSSSLKAPPVTVRLNLLKFTADEIRSTLESEGVSLYEEKRLLGCAKLVGAGSVEKLRAYKMGMFHVQDSSCQLCASLLGAKSGDVVLDMCSAPGGKAFTIAQLMADRGRVLAFDLHPNRTRLILEGAKRLGIECIEASPNNAKVFSDKLPMADAVLCDVPCSGLGVIRRKPEIKYGDRQAFAGLPSVQKEILYTSSRYVKKGGTLIYSTCTVNRSENDDIAESFLRDHSDFYGCDLEGFESYKTTLTPSYMGGDGFFIAKFKRKE